MKRAIRMFAVSAFVLIGAVCADAFDIAVYHDARSAVNWRSCNANQWYCGNASVPRTTAIGRIANEDTVYERFRELGVNYFIPFYPFADDFTALATRRLDGMKILNASYPGEAFKYLEAQNRDLWIGSLDSNYVDSSSWKLPTASGEFDEARGLWFLRASQDHPDTMWRPESGLGIWNGWNWREAGITGDIYMPMHYKITCNLVPNGIPEDTQPIATFYWLVREVRDTNWDGIIDFTGWWRYPGKVLTVGDFADPNRLDTIEFTIDPHPGMSGTFVLLDDDFQPTVFSADSHSYGADALDESADGLSYGTLWGVPVRMCIYYHGDNQTFQVYNVSIWDEGYHRLWVSPDSSDYYADIRSAFQQQYAGRDTLMAGWYFDEWPQTEQIKSYVKVNKILQGYVPTMWTNGHSGWPGCDWCPRNILFDEMTRQQVTLPVHMEEFYFLGGRRIYDVNIQWMYTFPQSDTTYFNLLGGRNDSVLAEKSLQCAIDGYIWGWPTIYTGWNVPVDEDWLGVHTELLEQVASVHGNGQKFWAMVQADDDLDSDSLDPVGNCVARRPTPNEVKLGAWLSVALDADGILWYPVGLGGGLLKWDPDSADQCLDPPRGLAIDDAEAVTTDRYFAAKKACNEILEVAPILESLDFVKTYASRAFLLDYPDQIGLLESPAIRLDTLANESWFNQSYRCVESIQSWVPTAFNQDSTAVTAWSENPEEHTYVQISRFRSGHTSPNDEDYWFLIVNRRALSNEFRKIRLTIEVNQSTMCLRRWADYILGDSMIVTAMPPNREDCHPTRYLDVVLSPGEAELVHFFRDLSPCDTTYAHIHQLTALPMEGSGIRLNWEQITETDSGDAFVVDTFFVRASRTMKGPFTTIAYSTTNSYVDTSGWSNLPICFYQVQACGHVTGAMVRARGENGSLSAKSAVHTKRNRN